MLQTLVHISQQKVWMLGWSRGYYSDFVTHSVPFFPSQRLWSAKRRSLIMEAAWRSSGGPSQMILAALHPPTPNLLYLPNLLTYRKEAHLWSTRTAGESTLLQDNTWCQRRRPYWVEWALCRNKGSVRHWWSRRGSWLEPERWTEMHFVSARLEAQPRERAKRLGGGVEWEKDLKAFLLKSTWMRKRRSFDVAEFKYALIVCVIDRQTEWMSGETQTVAYRWKNTMVDLFNEC